MTQYNVSVAPLFFIIVIYTYVQKTVVNQFQSENRG